MDKYSDEDLAEISEHQWQLLTTSFKFNKPLEKIKAISELILKMDPHLIFLTEVGGLESLENFNHHFLNNSFDIIHYPSNSDRGIDIAALVKRSLKIKSDFFNHHVFARGILRLEFKFNKNTYHFYHTHLKSKLNLKGKDYEGRGQRLKEVKKLTSLIKNQSLKYKIKPLITGDLNGIIYKEETEEELMIFANNLGLKDALEHLNYELFERFTYVYYNKQNEATLMQLDYCLMGDDVAAGLNNSTRVLGFNGEHRVDMALNRSEKNQYPSDHYPLYIELDLSKIK